MIGSCPGDGGTRPRCLPLRGIGQPRGASRKRLEPIRGEASFGARGPAWHAVRYGRLRLLGVRLARPGQPPDRLHQRRWRFMRGDPVAQIGVVVMIELWCRAIDVPLEYVRPVIVAGEV